MINNVADNERAVWILKTMGPQPLCIIAEELKITMEGARFQLLKLANDGLVQATTESKGRGRPKQIWSLTEAGNARFPDRHQELTLKLLGQMSKTLSPEGMHDMLDAIGQSNLEKYQEAMKGAHDLESKVRLLADIRNREGYMATFIKEEADYLLIENHCPILAAARCCNRFCRSEEDMFTKLLGEDATLTRIEHILDGQRRCVYRVSGK